MPSKDLSQVFISLSDFSITDGQKKRYNQILLGKTCDFQARAVRANHDKNLESSLEVVWFYHFLLDLGQHKIIFELLSLILFFS